MHLFSKPSIDPRSVHEILKESRQLSCGDDWALMKPAAQTTVTTSPKKSGMVLVKEALDAAALHTVEVLCDETFSIRTCFTRDELTSVDRERNPHDIRRQTAPGGKAVKEQLLSQEMVRGSERKAGSREASLWPYGQLRVKVCL